MYTQESMGEELLAIQQKIAELPEGDWEQKAVLDAQIVEIMGRRRATATGYDRLKAARDEIRAINELMRTRSKMNAGPAPYMPGLKKK